MTTTTYPTGTTARDTQGRLYTRTPDTRWPWVGFGAKLKDAAASRLFASGEWRVEHV